MASLSQVLSSQPLGIQLARCYEIICKCRYHRFLQACKSTGSIGLRIHDRVFRLTLSQFVSKRSLNLFTALKFIVIFCQLILMFRRQEMISRCDLKRTGCKCQKELVLTGEWISQSNDSVTAWCGCITVGMKHSSYSQYFCQAKGNNL